MKDRHQGQDHAAAHDADADADAHTTARDEIDGCIGWGVLGRASHCAMIRACLAASSHTRPGSVVDCAMLRKKAGPVVASAAHGGRLQGVAFTQRHPLRRHVRQSDGVPRADGAGTAAAGRPRRTVSGQRDGQRDRLGTGDKDRQW